MNYMNKYTKFKAKRKGKYLSTPNKLIVPGTSLVSDRAFVKLHFVQQLTKAAAPGYWDIIFRGNSIYDPYEALGGQTAAGLQQWSMFYRNYKVHASKMVVTVDNSVIGTGCYYALVPTPTTAQLGAVSPAYFDAYPRARTGYISGSTGGIAVKRIKNFCSTASALGVRKELVRDEDDLGALVTQNPARVWGWHLLVGSTNPAINSAFNVNIKIVYYVEFYNRKDPILALNSDTTDPSPAIVPWESDPPVFDADLMPTPAP